MRRHGPWTVLLAALAAGACRGSERAEGTTTLITYEIAYEAPEAAEVELVWGVDGWRPVADSLLPAGTVVVESLARTPMTRQADQFTASIRVPRATSIQHGFLITEARDGLLRTPVWDEDQPPLPRPERCCTMSYRASVSVSARRLLIAGSTPANAAAIEADDASVSHEIRYENPDAGHVYLVWGINGWEAVPESERPDGTEIRDRLMHTVMRRDGDVFSVTLHVPRSASVDYGFLVTHDARGRELHPLWDGDSGVPLPRDGGVTEVRTMLDAGDATLVPTLPRVVALVVLAVALLALLGWGLARIPQRPPYVALALVGLSTVAFGLRTAVIASTERLTGPDIQLIGDEPRYDELATDLVAGRFFEKPLATPVYPIFLAGHYRVFGHQYGPVLYSQALLGALFVPMVYLLALFVANGQTALISAGITAFEPSLLAQTGYLYSEVVYTGIFLAVMISLFWALREPGWRHFAVAGGLLGLAALTRPAIVFWPLALPLLLPRRWTLRQRGIATITYGLTMGAVITPWAYHNYRTYDTFLPFGLSLTMLWHGSPEFYHAMQDGDNAMLTVWANELNPAVNGGHDPMTIEGDRYFSDRAKAAIRAEPGVYALYSLEKLAYFWIGHPAASYDWPFDWPTLRGSMTARAIAYLYGPRMVILIGTLLAAFVLGPRLMSVKPIILMSLYFMGVYAVFSPVARYSVPLYPLLIIVIVMGAQAAAEKFRARAAP